MNYYTLKTKSGREIKLRLDAKSSTELVKELGCGIMTAFQSIYENPTGFTSQLIWASAQKFNHKFSKQDAYELVDELADDGYSIEKYAGLAAEILGVSGFFDQATVESFREELIEE